MRRLAQAIEARDPVAFGRATRSWVYCGLVAKAPIQSEDWRFLPDEGEPNPHPQVFHVEPLKGRPWSIQAALELPLQFPWPGVLVTAEQDGSLILEALASGALCIYHPSLHALLAPWEGQPPSRTHEGLKAVVAHRRLKSLVDLPLDLFSDRLPRSPHAHLQ